MYASTARTYLIAGTILLAIAAALVLGLTPPAPESFSWYRS